MNRGELRNLFRVLSVDTAKPYLWADDEVDVYINEAYTEAVDRGLVIYDRESFTVDVEVGVTAYQLDKSIIRVKEAILTAKGGIVLDDPLPLNKSNPWGTDPQGYAIEEDGVFVLAAPSNEAGIIALAVYRYPKPLESDSDELMIPPIYHAKMLSWALKLAYQKPDSDTFNADLSRRHDDEFTRTFGPHKTAQQHRQRSRNSARSIKTPGY